VSIVLKSGSLNFLEPSGPVQACNEIALPYPTIVYKFRPPKAVIRPIFTNSLWIQVHMVQNVNGLP